MRAGRAIESRGFVGMGQWWTRPKKKGNVKTEKREVVETVGEVSSGESVEKADEGVAVEPIGYEEHALKHVSSWESELPKGVDTEEVEAKPKKRGRRKRKGEKVSGEETDG